MLETLERELELLTLLKFVDESLHVVAGNVRVRVDDLVVDGLVEAHSMLLVRYLITKGNERRVEDVTPEASDSNAVIALLL